ncbi:hypothetical protein [Acetobacter estunensis]|uniref:hypothetical protein n=1 Tax=Acetobacter estunensis TaxID=104097 RepID=UPI001C2D6603|nr:hypothetical protein [Acetobacter estunensis]MBV1836195.1 hypothetical protein [Acetobacter estunensis]
MRHCSWCGEPFEGKEFGHYCSRYCADAAHREEEATAGKGETATASSSAEALQEKNIPPVRSGVFPRVWNITGNVCKGLGAIVALLLLAQGASEWLNRSSLPTPEVSLAPLPEQKSADTAIHPLEPAPPAPLPQPSTVAREDAPAISEASKTLEQPPAPAPAIAPELKTTTASPEPASAPDKPAVTTSSGSFVAGETARKKWDRWVRSLSGESRKGALYWAAGTNAHTVRRCDGTEDFALSCFTAQRKLAGIEQRRTHDLNFDRGWKAGHRALR